MMLGPALGPTLGGIVIQAYDWRGIFWINVPVGLLALVLAWRNMAEYREDRPGRFDWLGWLMVSPGVALVIYGLTQASQHGWQTGETLRPLGLGALLVAGFLIWELRHPEPLLDVRIFRSSAYRAAIVVSVIVASALFGPAFLVPVFLEQLQHHTVLEAGLILGAQGLGAAVLMPIAGLLTDRYGASPVVTVGVVVIAVATVLMTAVAPSTTPAQWAGLLALRGVGLGLAMIPAMSSAYTGLAADQIGRATAMANTLQRIFSSVGVAIMATVLTARIAADLPSHARPSPASVSRAYDETFWVAAAMVLLALPAALLIRRAVAPGRRPPTVPYPLASAVAVLATATSLYFLAVGFRLAAAPLGWHAG
jgi:EmrB/QacA subfamily drug resistance transporter